MNEFSNRYINSNFKYNRKIMLGIILSITLTITVVTLVLSSSSIVEKIFTLSDYNKGNMQATLFDVPVSSISNYQDNGYNIYISQNIGYSKFDSNTNVKNINLVGIDIDNINKYPLELIEGRLPANDSEILVTTNIINSNPSTAINVGNDIDLELNEYYQLVNGEEIKVNQSNYCRGNKLHKNNKLFDKTYKIVGIIKMNNSMFEEYYSLRIYCNNNV